MTTSILDFLHFNNPTTGQVTALKGVQSFVHPSSSDKFLILRGAAGTGKTSIVSALVGYLNDENRPYQIAAPTGRAARIIGRKVGAGASTVHSMIFIPETEEKTGKVTFQMKQRLDDEPTVYIIDEASMISTKNPGIDANFGSEASLLTSLIQYIFRANQANKIIFIGDVYQLPPVGEAKSYALEKDYLESNYDMTGQQYELTEVKRQEDGSYILENATNIREAIDAGCNSYRIAGTESGSIYKSAENYAYALQKDGADRNITISVSHKANKFFNDLVRTQLFGQDKNILEPGDLMIVTRNWTRNGNLLFNGDHVEIVEIDWNSLETVSDLNFVAVKFRPVYSDEVIEDLLLLDTVINLGGRIESEKEMNLYHARYTKNKIFRETQSPEDDKYVGALKLMYGHAITCHKAQGGEWDKVFINKWGIPNLKWQYTAITRGISRIETF